MNTSLPCDRIVRLKGTLQPEQAKQLSSWTRVDWAPTSLASQSSSGWDNFWDQGAWNNFDNFAFNNWGQ